MSLPQVIPVERMGVWILVGAMFLLPLMITGESLWLDEGDTALYAIQPTFRDWLQRLVEDRIADCQMPLTMLTAWLAAQVVGAGEIGLRSQNILWGAVALLALWRVGQRVRAPWLPLLLVIQPFFWFYMDEARPYAAQIACGSVLLWLLVSFFSEEEEPSRRWLFCFFAAVLITYMASMLCAVTLLAVMLVIAFGAPRKAGNLLWENRVVTGFFLTLFGILSAYYLWTVSKGAAGSRIWAVDLKSIGFIFYEFIGCLGLGPSLDVIREHAREGHLETLIPSFLIPLSATMLLLVLIGYWLKAKAERTALALAAPRAVFILVFTGVVMVIASYLLHKPLWARHFSPILPFLVFLQAATFQSAFQSKRRWLQGVVVAFTALLVISSLEIRFSRRFVKDDYREAAKVACSALLEGKKVWWVAAEYPAQYYNVPLNRSGKGEGAVLLPMVWFEKALENGAPDLIITTRREVYDPSGSITAFASEGYTTLDSPNNFRLYSKL